MACVQLKRIKYNYKVYILYKLKIVIVMPVLGSVNRSLQFHSEKMNYAAVEKAL